MTVVQNAAIGAEVLKTEELNFACRPEFGAQKYDIYKDSMFSTAPYGAYWRFIKKVCMTELLSPRQISRFVDIRREERLKLLDVLVKSSELGKACNVGAEMMIMTNNIICRLAMSTRTSKNADESSEIWDIAKGVGQFAGKLALGEMLGPLKKIDLLGIGRKSRDMMIRFDNFVDKIMVEHENKMNRHSNGGFSEGDKKDLMDILLEDIFLGGTDTTSVSLQWTLARLINSPQAFKKLRDEINSVVGPTRLVEESDVPNLPYLQAIVKESLRLNPSLPLIYRKCIKDCKINGYDIVEGSRMVVNVYAINRDPVYWKNPDDFIPERFLESSMNNHRVTKYQLDIKGQNQNYNYLPFGSGRRGCPGVGLASVVLHVTIASLVQCFDWKIDGGDLVDLEEGSGFSVGMAHPLVCYPVAIINPLDIALHLI
ncbi:hypothetical protein LguiB_004418 [Lonicera macranthoides]